MDYLHVERKGGIGIITLNRPEKRNALSFELVGELKSAFTEMISRDLVKVIILRAKGKAFCAGADLKYIQNLQGNTFEENLEDSNHLKELFHLIYTASKPVIAEVQGHAIAGGCGLATICDFVFAVPEAKFGYSEVRIGFIPALVSIFLTRKIGEGRAREMLLSANMYPAEDARSMGLINYVVEADSLRKEVESFAENLISQNSSQAMGLTKQLFVQKFNTDLDSALEITAKMNAEARGTEDCKKGIHSFLNKEPISWN